LKAYGGGSRQAKSSAEQVRCAGAAEIKKKCSAEELSKSGYEISAVSAKGVDKILAKIAAKVH